MGTVNRTIEKDTDKVMASRLIESRAVPFTLTITDGKSASTKQNKTQFMWFKEIAEQKGDTTAQEVRAYCKLVIGVPILRDQNEAFRIRYDEVLKPLSYEQKIAIMGEPFNLPVTSLMSVKQMSEYMDAIFRHFSAQGVVLTIPDDPSFHSGPDLLPGSEQADAPPSSALAGSSSPGAASQPIKDDMRGQMIAFAAVVVGYLKNELLTDGSKIESIDRSLSDWQYAISPTEHERMASIAKAAGYVVSGQRSITQFVNYLAVDLLDCTMAELGA